jgi:hypothetical protein
VNVNGQQYNTTIERASKQLNILRKLKFKLNKQYLDIYQIYIGIYSLKESMKISKR